MSTLPNKLSELITVALADLKACEKDDKYAINMRDWHMPSGDVCEVCFAGAVMAKTLCVNPKVWHDPLQNIFSDNLDKLMALNQVRIGRVQDALQILDKGIEAYIKDDAYTVGIAEEHRTVVQYVNDPALFHNQMNGIANDLQELGL